MKRRIIKPVLAGILLGAALFFIPFFVLRVTVFLLITGIMFSLFAGRRRFGRRFAEGRTAFADHIRNMSEEEYNRFKADLSSGCRGRSSSSSSTEKQYNMQWKYRILTVFIAAVITFSSLLIFLGPQQFKKNIHPYPGRHNCAQHDAGENKQS